MGGQQEGICPICREEMDLTDQELRPCICGYEICLWCWHFIIQTAKKDGADARCPSCCCPYDKEKTLKRTINIERLAMVNPNKKHTPQKTKQKTTDLGKDLCNIRVIRRNIVYIAGIPKSLSDEKTLMKKEYLGQYGKIIKIFFAQTDGSRQYYSTDSCIVYVTFSKEEDALRCIQVVNGYILNGRTLRASFGTTRYCYSWLKNLPCKNPDCLYVHDVVPEEDICRREEVIPFCTSKLQQCSGLTFSNLKQHSGSFLPPPLDTKNLLPPLVLNTKYSHMQSDYFGRSYASVAASDNQSIHRMNDAPVIPSSRAEVCVPTNSWDYGLVNNVVSAPRNETPFCIPDYRTATNTKLFAEDNTCRISSYDEHISEGIVEDLFSSDSDGYSQLSTFPASVTTPCSTNSFTDKWKCETLGSSYNKISGWDDLASVSSELKPFLSFQALPCDSTLTRQSVLPSCDRSTSGSDLGSEKFIFSFEDERLSTPRIKSRCLSSSPTISTELHHRHNKSSAFFPTGSILFHGEHKNMCSRSSIFNDPDFDFPQNGRFREEKFLEEPYTENSEDSILSDILALDLDATNGPTQTHNDTEVASSDDSSRISSSWIRSTDDDSKSYFSMDASGQLFSWSNSGSGLKDAYMKHSVNKFWLENSKNSEVLNGITLLSSTEAADGSRRSLDMHYSGTGYSLTRATKRCTLSTPPGFPPLKSNQGSPTSQSQQHTSPSASLPNTNPKATATPPRTCENPRADGFVISRSEKENLQHLFSPHLTVYPESYSYF